MSIKVLTKDLINKFSILNGARYFFRHISKLFSINTSQKYIEYFSGTTQIESWKYNGMLEENI